MVIKFINKLDELTIKKIKKEETKETKKEEIVSEEILLLRSINDNIKKANSKNKKKS